MHILLAPDSFKILICKQVAEALKKFQEALPDATFDLPYYWGMEAKPWKP